MSLVSKECWQLRCIKVVMVSPAEGGNGIPAPKCILSGKVQNELVCLLQAVTFLVCGLNDVTCHVRVQYKSNGCKMLLDLQA